MAAEDVDTKADTEDCKACDGTGKVDGKTCSKCEKNPASNGNAWCQPCRTENARKVKDLEAEMIGARNWIAGAKAIRLAMAQRLARGPGHMLEARSVAEWMMQFEIPDYPGATKTPNGKTEPAPQS